MGLFRSGFFACLVVGSTAFAQQPNPAVPAPAPGIPDTNAPAILQPAPAPEVDPNVLQPAPAAQDAAATNAPHAKPKKPAAPALPTIRGSVSAIDKTAMTITIKGKSREETLNISSKTRIFADNKPAILADAKEGENVLAEYHTTKEKTKEALLLRFGGAGAPEHKAEVKPAPKKSTKAAKASAKKKKKTPATDNAAPAPGTENPVTPLPTPEPAVPAPAPGAPTTNP